MRGITAVLIAAALLAAADSSVAAAAAWKPIYKVDSAAAFVRGSHMTIIVSGAVSTGGWGGARLRVKPTHKAESGEIEFQFLSVPPPTGKTVIQALVPVTATLTMHVPIYTVTQVRVDSQTNSIVTDVGH